MQLINYSLKIKNKKLLSNVTLNFDAGNIHHILGRNGVGKSCFAKSLLGFFEYSGEIRFEGLKRKVIGSYSNIPSDICFKDVEYLLSKQNSTMEIQSLKDNIMPNGLINPKTEIKYLSDGEKQKIKLLFFLIDHPDIIVLDEFTTSLDQKSTLEIYQFISNYVKENNIICLNITHNLSDLEYLAGKYYYFSNQTIKEIASKEEAIQQYIRGDLP